MSVLRWSRSVRPGTNAFQVWNLWTAPVGTLPLSLEQFWIAPKSVGHECPSHGILSFTIIEIKVAAFRVRTKCSRLGGVLQQPSHLRVSCASLSSGDALFLKGVLKSDSCSNMMCQRFPRSYCSSPDKNYGYTGGHNKAYGTLTSELTIKPMALTLE